MITWIYLSGVLVTFFLLIINISVNNEWKEYSDISGKCAVLSMSLLSWFYIAWLIIVDEK